MAKIQRLYDFQNGTRTDAEQVDAEFDNLVKAHNDQDDEVKKKLDITGNFEGTWNGVPFEEADPAIAGRVTVIENMVKEEEPVTITLKRGENNIEAPENAALAPVEILGDEVKNLVPPFNSGKWSGGGSNVTVNSDNKITIVSNGSTIVHSTSLPVKSGSTYFLSGKRSYDTGTYIDAYGGTSLDTTNVPEKFTVPQGVNSIQVRCIVDNKAQGAIIFEDVQLIEATEEREFVLGYQPVRNPYIEVDNGSALHFDEYLYKGDKIYQTSDGEWRKKQNKIESLLTSENVKNPKINTSYTGGKGILIPLSEVAPGINISSVDVIKFNGVFMQRTDSASNIINDRFYLDENSLILFLSSADTGWGDNYKPSRLEILAFLLGWQMQEPSGAIYNSGTKKWYAGFSPNSAWSPITDNAYTKSSVPTALAPDFKPIKIIYKTSTEQDVSAKYEGALRLVKGTNKINLGEGIVLREKANPYQNTLAPFEWNINNGVNSLFGVSKLQNKAEEIFSIYEQGRLDKRWKIYPKGTTSSGAMAQLDNALYNKAAFYTVTYKVLNRYNFSCHVGDTQAKHTENFHMESDYQVKQIEEMNKQLSQFGLTVIDKLGRKDGVALLDKNGVPLKSDGSPVGMKKEYVFWSDKTTSVAPNGEKYSKKITLPGNGFWYRLILEYSRENRSALVFEWNKKTLEANENSPYVTYDAGYIYYIDKLKYGTNQSFVFNNTQLYNPALNPLRYPFSSGAECYIEFIGLNEDCSELEIRWVNVGTVARTLSINVSVEVLTQ
ncbi:hypothetical protein [Cytobacillus sp.]|uniref:hypothetical protein n=1 Tax=Cytobacillus sp. TaxID=2675269 RepID=UPI0028BEE4D9|nr:hypothetical protein [Cytobacillus sp.]